MTDQYYLIGEEVSASPSPAMLNAAFRHSGLDAEYHALSVPRTRLHDEFLSLREKGAEGLNITIPFKTDVIPLLDGLDDLSDKIRAVNTVKRSGGAYIGFNTDVYGIVRALGIHRKKSSESSLLIGAGGVARAFCGAGDRLGFGSITVAVRDPMRASGFLEDMKAAFPKLVSGICEIGSLREGGFDLVFNATPLGSEGVPPNSALRRILTPETLVFDAVYRPVQTELLAAASSTGCETINGCELLLGQALGAFEIWTGRSASPQVMEREMLTLIREWPR